LCVYIVTHSLSHTQTHTHEHTPTQNTLPERELVLLCPCETTIIIAREICLLLQSYHHHIRHFMQYITSEKMYILNEKDIYIYIYTHTRTHDIYIYIHTHTHTHTHARAHTHTSTHTHSARLSCCCARFLFSSLWRTCLRSASLYSCVFFETKSRYGLGGWFFSSFWDRFMAEQDRIGVLGMEEEGGGVRSGPGAARTILRFYIISARPSKQPLMVRTFLKVHTRLRLAYPLRCRGC